MILMSLMSHGPAADMRIFAEDPSEQNGEEQLLSGASTGLILVFVLRAQQF